MSTYADGKIRAVFKSDPDLFFQVGSGSVFFRSDPDQFLARILILFFKSDLDCFLGRFLSRFYVGSRCVFSWEPVFFLVGSGYRKTILNYALF